MTALPLFIVIMFGVGYLVWLVTGSKQAAGIAGGIIGVGAGYVIGYYDGKSSKMNRQ